MDVQRFLARLLAHRCFESGTFVVSLRDPRARAFVAALRGVSRRRPIARTHDVFQRREKLARQRLCGGNCRVDARWLTAGPQYEYVPRAPMRFACAGAKSFGVLLWYEFALGSKKYAFMKLESHASTSPAHVVGAVRRYVLRSPAARTRLEPRREDAYKDRGWSPSRALHLSSANAAWLSPAGQRESAEYDASLRTGAEVFVPSDLAGAAAA